MNSMIILILSECFTDNPPINRILRKRKLEERGEERTRKFFTRAVNVNLVDSLKKSRFGDAGDKMFIEEMNRDDDDEMNNKQFQQGKNIEN